MKGRKLKLGEEKRSPRADDFPTYELLEKITILDIRDEEEVEIYGKMPNPFIFLLMNILQVNF